MCSLKQNQPFSSQSSVCSSRTLSADAHLSVDKLIMSIVGFTSPVNTFPGRKGHRLRSFPAAVGQRPLVDVVSSVKFRGAYG